MTDLSLEERVKAAKRLLEERSESEQLDLPAEAQAILIEIDDFLDRLETIVDEDTERAEGETEAADRNDATGSIERESSLEWSSSQNHGPYDLAPDEVMIYDPSSRDVDTEWIAASRRSTLRLDQYR